MAYFTELEQKYKKSVWNYKRPHIVTAILRKKNKVGGIMWPDGKLYYKAIVIKRVMYWHENWHRSMEQNRAHKETCAFVVNYIWQRRQKPYNGLRIVLFNKWCWGSWTDKCKKKNKLDDFLTLHTRINSKRATDLNVRLKTRKILEENIGSNFLDISCSNIFFWYISSGKGNKGKK